MNEISSKSNRRMKIDSRLSEFRNKQKKQAYLVTTVWFIIAISLTILIAVIFQLNESPLRNLISSFVITVVILSWINYIPFLGILISIVVRTRSKNYFKQLFPNLGLLVVITIVALINFIEFKEDLFTALFIGFLLIIIIFESIFLRLVIQDARQNIKPLFIWTFFQDPFMAYKSTILTQQALELLNIEEEQNGYSQRPFFAPFLELNHYCPTEEEFKSKIKDYAIFLTERSDLIGWECKTNIIRLYPRVLIGNPNMGLGIRYLWEVFAKVMRKKDLTYISINYETKELALSVSRQDYDLLNDVTYHLLGKSLLKRFKQSLIAYMKNGPEAAYIELFPLKN
ncbi:MAG: hypothetical protein ACFE8U_01855 [Candidatus Hermodarchaeota archaeon]